jgi:2-dehydropantoate 2-reductase
MRIAIVGSGGVGGYFGGRIAAAGGDVDVSFIARGAHLQALREHGLAIESPLGNIHLPRVNATDDTASIGAVDYVFFTVKLYDTAGAIAMLEPLLGPETIVIPFQNGVDSIDMLTNAIGAARVAGGTTYVSAVIDRPGVIRHTAMNTLVFGPLDASQQTRLERLRDVVRAAGAEVVLSERIRVDIWTKFARLTVFSGMTSIARCPIGPVMADADLFAMVESALRESIAVARARTIDLPAGTFDDIIAAHRALPASTKSSMLEDLERGRPLELPWLSGAVVRMGEESGVPTPTHRLITALLRPHVNGA